MAPTSVLSTSFQLNGHQINVLHLLLVIEIILLLVIKSIDCNLLLVNPNNFVIDSTCRNCCIAEPGLSYKLYGIRFSAHYYNRIPLENNKHAQLQQSIAVKLLLHYNNGNMYIVNQSEMTDLQYNQCSYLCARIIQPAKYQQHDTTTQRLDFNFIIVKLLTNEEMKRFQSDIIIF